MNLLVQGKERERRGKRKQGGQARDSNPLEKGRKPLEKEKGREGKRDKAGIKDGEEKSPKTPLETMKKTKKTSPTLEGRGCLVHPSPKDHLTPN
jgi:hypothetical protein